MKIKKFLSQSHIFALYQAQNRVLESFQQHLSTQGVHLLQGLILTSLFFEDKAVRPVDLAATFRVEKSTLSHALRSLEKKGFLRRSMHASDARGYVFELTGSGRKKAVALVKEFDAVQNTFESSWGVKKAKEFVDSIHQFISEYETAFKSIHE